MSLGTSEASLIDQERKIRIKVQFIKKVLASTKDGKKFFLLQEEIKNIFELLFSGFVLQTKIAILFHFQFNATHF